MEELLNTAQSRMEKTLSNFRTELSRIRTGRASPALLENIKVEYYGNFIPLIQIAGIGVPEPRLLVVQPWDKAIVGEIEKAILKSGLGLVPRVEGNVLKIPIPPLSEERRIELTKLVKKLAEEAKVAIRNIRRDVNDRIKAKKDNKEISEDTWRMETKKIQDLTDEYIEKIDEIVKKKEKEIMEE